MDGNSREGFVVINKPGGITSFDVIRSARKKLGIRKIGHGGTLDPMATGVLILLVGRATKKFEHFMGLPKEYRATIKLGESTTTGDAQGEIVDKSDAQEISGIKREDVVKILEKFRGRIKQVPPMVSALRYKGQRLYELARKNITVERKPRDVVIYEIKILDCQLPFFEVYIKCSKGTYVRKIAEDIGEELSVGAHVTRIERLAVGPYRIEQAVNLEDLREEDIRNI